MMTFCESLIQHTAARFTTELANRRDCEMLCPAFIIPSISGLTWDNVLLEGSIFRHAHVEVFAVTGRVCVLHVCIIPHLNNPAPIFGFDMIAGPARVTGMFLDLSPVTTGIPRPRLRDVLAHPPLAPFAHVRERPDWGGIFSDDFLAIRPTSTTEILAMADAAFRSFTQFLATLVSLTGPPREDVYAGQTRYLQAQRANQHTFRLLANVIGHDQARRFIDDVLFPNLDLPANLQKVSSKESFTPYRYVAAPPDLHTNRCSTHTHEFRNR